jgi:hypothetical protein
MKKGPGTNEDQVKALQTKVGDAGVKKADVIISQYTPEVIALAYKRVRINAAKNKLPKNVTKMLGKLSDTDAAIVRNKLTQVKA